MPGKHRSSSKSALAAELLGLHVLMMHVLCRNPHVVLFIGAYLGEQQLYMVQELMAGDLATALADPKQQEQLRWQNRYCIATLTSSIAGHGTQPCQAPAGKARQVRLAC